MVAHLKGGLQHRAIDRLEVHLLQRFLEAEVEKCRVNRVDTSIVEVFGLEICLANQLFDLKDLLDVIDGVEANKTLL